ncbi:YtpR family tRNA-binding protein [Piscibacillus salipiscarius]|uniref:YtpR family tRNA-binding protein n=1 Tax=Piscibacillus salipiscarius TaxID=299480 RepID=A0ABW5QDZ4_9BACI
MQFVYNKQGIGDVLIITLNQKESEVTHETIGDVVKLLDEDGQIVGYNIFNVSNYLSLTGNGPLEATEELVNDVKSVFEKNDVQDELNIDLTPKFVVGYVKEMAPHEDATKLNVCQVDVGDEELQIVCGAPNVEAGQKVVVAKVGAMMPTGMLIKDSSLRGVASSGMICSAKELNLPNASEKKGILVLSDDYEVGAPFNIYA